MFPQKHLAPINITDNLENLMRTFSSLALILSSALVLTACGSAVKLDDKAKIEDRTATPTASADTRTVQQVSTSTDPLNDPQGVLAKRSVYFDYDSYIVKDEFKPVVEAHGKYLVSHKDRKVVIQGNTDERGGSEYNLALGQKRAEAVRKSLSLLGVPDSQMEAVSFGKEKPKATGHDEAAWAENRRADIAYQ
jgi:peptidoglycan-associated lipoprotein